MHPRLSVVIVNYNTRDDLRACLTALAASQPPPEIIVVDNASSDGSADMVRAEFSAVTLLTPGRNLWFCGGNNLGIDAAHGEYVLLLNPDTVAPPDALARMVAAMDAQPDYAGMTVQLRYPDGQIQRTCSRIPTYTYLLLNHTPLGWLLPGLKQCVNAHHWYADWDRESSRAVEVVPGSCLLMRRADLRLDDHLLLYFPEDDLARRLAPHPPPAAPTQAESGGEKSTFPTFYFAADIAIIHREKAATRTWTATRVYFRDLIVYTYTHHGMLAAALLWLLSRPLYWGMGVKRQVRGMRNEE